MLKFNVLTLFPEMFNGFTDESIIKRAIDDKKIKIDIICLIKPQFECGKEIADKYKGIILNKSII